LTHSSKDEIRRPQGEGAVASCKADTCPFLREFRFSPSPSATTLGHHNATMADPVYLDLVTRGLLWSLDRLTERGETAPGYGPAGK
jgi:hypothetical protein